MKLLIPEQSEPAADALPNQPRKLKKILAKLPNANMGELTKQVYQILRELNRQTMPAGNRLENMELLRPSAREIFTHLKKYFINRTLPLPEKSKKIVNLNQALLQEMAYGYKIVITDIVGGDEAKKDTLALATACCRSIRYLSELLLRSSEIYVLPPGNFWRDAHQIYFLAENYELLETGVDDDETEQENINVENCYKQMLLFVLARPIALRQSDNERVFQKLTQWADYSHIETNASKDMIDKVFCIKINEDIAPDYLTEKDFKYANAMRYLNAQKLVSHLKKLLDLAASQPEKLTIGDEISPESLKMLTMNWGTSTKRRFSRSNREEKIKVSIGLSNIVTTLRKKAEEENSKFRGIDSRSGLVPTDHVIKKMPEFTLENIQSDDISESSDNYMTHTEVSGAHNNSWDMVARGTVLTEAYDLEQKKQQEKSVALKKQTDSHWEVVNFSAGGYCLRWNSDATSRAQIGELIALHEKVSENNYAWRTGIIRWMQFTQENGLEIGIQVISPKVVSATIQRLNRRNEPPLDCLVLPAIKVLKQASSILLPAHAFKTSDKVVITLSGKNMDITLTTPKENTGSFTQFHYSINKDATKQTQEKQTPATKNQDDFDEIWSSL